MPAAEEAAGGGEGARMGSRQDQMLRIGEHGNLALCRASPEHVHNGAVLPVDCGDHRVRELLPALSLMGICLMGAYREHGV